MNGVLKMAPEQLYALIEKQALDVDAMSAADIATHINEHETVTDKPGEIGPDDIMAALGDDAVTVLASLQKHAAAGDTGAALLVQQVAAGKVNPAGPLVRTVIERAAADWPDGLKDRVLDLGRKRVQLTSEDVTADEVTAALQWRKNSQRLANNYNAAVDALAAGADWPAIESALLGGE